MHSGTKKTPKAIKTPYNFEYEFMIFSYAEYFKLDPDTVANTLTELKWYEWYVYKINRECNQIYQSPTFGK